VIYLDSDWGRGRWTYWGTGPDAGEFLVDPYTKSMVLHKLYEDYFILFSAKESNVSINLFDETNEQQIRLSATSNLISIESLDNKITIDNIEPGITVWKKSPGETVSFLYANQLGLYESNQQYIIADASDPSFFITNDNGVTTSKWDQATLIFDSSDYTISVNNASPEITIYNKTGDTLSSIISGGATFKRSDSDQITFEGGNIFGDYVFGGAISDTSFGWKTLTYGDADDTTSIAILASSDIDLSGEETTVTVVTNVSYEEGSLKQTKRTLTFSGGILTDVSDETTTIITTAESCPE